MVDLIVVVVVVVVCAVVDLVVVDCNGGGEYGVNLFSGDIITGVGDVL